MQKQFEIEDLDMLKRDYKCISEAPRNVSVDASRYWGMLHLERPEYFLCENPALMRAQAEEGKAFVSRLRPVRVHFTAARREKKKTDWPDKQEARALVNTIQPNIF